MSKDTVRSTLGFLGVIASLLFVGFEIRQNNRLAQAAAFQSIGVASAAAWDAQAHDADFIAMELKAPEELTHADWMRWRDKFTSYARLAETTLLQIQTDVLEPDAMLNLGFSGWSQIFDSTALNYHSPIPACVWPQIRPMVSDSFRAYVEYGRDVDAIDCTGFDLPWDE